MPATLTGLFHDGHRQVYGYIAEAEKVEIVSYRVRAVVTMPKYDRGRCPQRSQRAKCRCRCGGSTSKAIGPTAPSSPGRARSRIADRRSGDHRAAGHHDAGAAGWSDARDSYANLILTRIAD